MNCSPTVIMVAVTTIQLRTVIFFPEVSCFSRVYTEFFRCDSLVIRILSFFFLVNHSSKASHARNNTRLAHFDKLLTEYPNWRIGHVLATYISKCRGPAGSHLLTQWSLKSQSAHPPFPSQPGLLT